MFSTALRVILIAGALATVAFMLWRIRRSRMQIRDSIFWIIFSGILLVLSIFPDLASWASQLLGFVAPINFVYLFIIFVLLIRMFSNTLRISQLDAKVQHLAQRLALYEKDQADATPPHKEQTP